MKFTKSMGYMRSNLERGISATAIALAIVVATPAMAQSDSATLEGHVDSVAAGTKVVATDTYTGQKLTGTIDADGNYQIYGLRPSTYKVEVEGKDPQQTTLLIGQTAVVDFSDQTGEIVVTGNLTRTEVRTSTVTTNVTPAQIENLPQNKRNFLSFAELAPGVAVTRGGNSQVQAGATSSSNVNVLLDGMSIKNPINHGGVFGQNFGLGNPFPQNAIQEYKVETQNFGAETGQAGSAVITGITKSGGDEFHGGAFIQFQPKWLIEQPYFDKQNNVPKPTYNRKQFGGELGGPIIPGVLTFYVAGEGTIQKLPAATANVTQPSPQNLISDVLVARNTDFKQGLYFGKLTFYASDQDTVNLSAFLRREDNFADIDTNATPSHGRNILTNQDRFQLNWRHNGDSFVNTFNVSYDKGTQSTPSVGTGPEFVLSNAQSVGNPGTDFSAAILAGAHFFEQGDNSKVITIKDDLILPRGDHTFKMGGQLAFMDLSRTVNERFNGSYYFQNPCFDTPANCPVANYDFDTATPYGARINLAPSPTLDAKNTQIGFYIQDEWKPDEHWTINAGIRWDYETNQNNNKYVTPTAIATALRNYPGWQAAGIDPEDYISDGNNRKAQKNMFQPRFGLSYDVYGDRDLVIFGGAGRYYDRSLFIAGVIETLTNANKVVDVRFCSAPNTPAGCITYTPALRDPDALRDAVPAGTGGGVFVLNNKTKAPYSDQFNIGVRKRLGAVQAEVTLSHVRSHNIFQFERANYFENGWYSRFVTRDGAGNVTGCTDGGTNWIQDGSPSGLSNGDGSPVSTAICAAQNAQLAGFSGKLNRGVNDGKAKYTAVYIKLEKPFTDSSTWGFTTALTLQWAKSNVAQELNNDEFFNGADQTGFGYQRVNGVEDWRWVTAGNFRGPWDMQLSGNLTLSSGPRFGNVIFGPAPDGACCYGNFGGPLKPKPLFGYKRLDLRVAKTFNMPYGAGHELTFDFQAFNVFNWLNRNYSSWGAGSGNPPPYQENSQVGNDARSFQAGIKYKF